MTGQGEGGEVLGERERYLHGFLTGLAHLHPQPEAEEGRGEAFPCQDCGGSTRTWFASNAVWNPVMEGSGGMLCPNCFIDRAEAVGMVPTAWMLTLERPSRQWTWDPS